MADPRRYDIHAGQHLSGDYATCLLRIEESPCGEWVKWHDFVDYKAGRRRNRSEEIVVKLGIEIAELRSRIADLEGGRK